MNPKFLQKTMARMLFILTLILFIVGLDQSWASKNHEPTSQEIMGEWVLQGDESDAIFEEGYEIGDEDDAVYRDEIKEGGELMAVYENELPEGAKKVQPGDEIAPEGEREGKRVVPGVDRFVPGGVEPGEYDGTKDTGKEIWAMESFLEKGGKRFRFYGDKVFQASVEVIRHKEPRWRWGSHTTEKVSHEKKFKRERVGEKIIKKRVGKKLTRKKKGYEIVRKLKRDPSGGEDAEPKMMPVRCPVYKRVLAPEYQKYRVPLYRWKPVKVGNYERSSFLTWIKRYRWVKRKYILWTHCCSFDEFANKYPRYVDEAKSARRVTDRMMEERAELMQSVRAPNFDTFLRDEKPKSDPRREYFMKQKRKSVEPGVDKFVEHGVPEAEIVSIPPSKKGKPRGTREPR